MATKNQEPIRITSRTSRAEIERIVKSGRSFVFDEGYPQAPSNRPKKSSTARKKK